MYWDQGSRVERLLLVIFIDHSEFSLCFVGGCKPIVCCRLNSINLCFFSAMVVICKDKVFQEWKSRCQQQT